MASAGDDRSVSGSGWGVPPAGYRLPASSRLGAVRLQVADVERSLAFYEGLLGLEVRDRGAGAALGARGGDAVLIELRESRGASPVPRTGWLGLYHFALLLPDRTSLGALLRHLERQGVRAGMADHAVSEAIYLTDPDGLGLEVYADRPRSEWRHENRQLRMVSEPLEVHDLLGAAVGTEWEGPPAGTVVGHIHLFVTDLDLASGFYHEGLGLDRVVWSYPGALFLSFGGYHHHVGVNTWAARAPRPRDDDARLLEWTVVVPSARDAEAAGRSLEAVGAEVEPADGGGIVVADPWGTRLGIRVEPAR